MNFSENTTLTPGGQSASPSKVKELENKIDDLAQTVTSVADSVADLSNTVTTSELNATSASISNATVDNSTVGSETVTTLSATTASADNLNATDADITNLTADDVEANSVDADNGYFGSVNAQSFTGQSVNVSEDVTAANKVQGKTVQATEKVVTPALESTNTELKGATLARGDVYFPEDGDKIYGEYLEVDANKVDADTVKVNSLITETPTGSSQLVGYDNNGNLIPVDAGLDPGNYWENVPNPDPDPEVVRFIKPKDNKCVQAPAVMAEYIAAMTKVEGVEVVAGDLRAVDTLSVEPGCETTLKDTEIDGDLTVNGDIIQNGSAYETHAEKVYSKKDLIITRDGAVSGLSTGDFTGIQATKYDGTNDGQLVFDKDGVARVGDVGSLQALATREDTPTDNYMPYWDAATNKFCTTLPTFNIICSSNAGDACIGTIGTLTNYPNGMTIKVLFINGHYGSTFTLNIDGQGAKPIWVNKDGSPAAMSSNSIDRDGTTRDWYVQPYTTLELMYVASLNGNAGAWLVIGNPVVISSSTSGYTIYANGYKESAYITGNWTMQKIGNTGYWLGLAVVNAVTISINSLLTTINSPSNFTILEVISGEAFMSGNTSAVTEAVHTNLDANAIVIYVSTAGTYQFRAIALFTES